jgi:choline kinase
MPSGESPLLHPSNTHRQLVVIDFEYASANPPGMEFANHFTEWCYNYHHPTQSYACNTAAYPTPQEQHRFIRSYVMHRPQYNPSASATPKLAAKEGSIEAFRLDSRGASQQTQDYAAEERAREEAAEVDIQHLLRETQMWRLANSAQWIAWGIVQAKVPELDDMPKDSKTAAILDKIKTSVQEKLHPPSDPVDAEVKALQEDAKADRPEGSVQEAEHDKVKVEAEEEDHEDFDYLTYAQDRAMFFWGDALQMGLVAEEELPEGMRQHIKFVKY